MIGLGSRFWYRLETRTTIVVNDVGYLIAYPFYWQTVKVLIWVGLKALQGGGMGQGLLNNARSSYENRVFGATFLFFYFFKWMVSKNSFFHRWCKVTYLDTNTTIHHKGNSARSLSTPSQPFSQAQFLSTNKRLLKFLNLILLIH